MIMPTAKNKLINQRIEKGLIYLYNNQFPNGEFPTYLSLSADMDNRDSLNMDNRENVNVIFDTAFILHTLNLVDDEHTKEIVNEMRTKAVDFLLDNKEPHGVWRFYGKNSTIPPDIDCTSLAFASLVESGVNISNESLDYMLNYRTPEGVFYVWIDPDEWPKVDPCVNANALYAYSLREKTQNGVIGYLNDIAENASFLNGSAYYPSPYVFTYLFTKAYSDGKVNELKPSLSKIKEYLLETQNPDGGWGNDLNTALATTSLINLGFKGEHLERAIGHILINQDKNGSWDIYGLYIAPGDSLNPIIYFGSRELTTSFSLEALIKYKNNILKKDNIIEDEEQHGKA